jgi:cytochrome c biogenesis factor
MAGEIEIETEIEREIKNGDEQYVRCLDGLQLRIAARQPENILEVKLQLEAHKTETETHTLTCSRIATVRVYTKKRNFQKERQPVWSVTKHKVNKIEESHGQKFYHVEGYAKPLMRHEILKL